MEDLHSIIKGCIQHDQRCEKMLYEKYYAYAFKVAFRYIYRYEKVADIVNDGFVKVFQSFHSFIFKSDGEIEYSLLAWIKKIMVNTAIDELRKSNMMPEIGSIPEDAWDVMNNSENADKLLLYKELILLVKRLPPVYRIVFNMYVIDGFSHREIAEHLGVSVGTTKSNLFKARAYLQNLINKDFQQAGNAIFK
ncbi:MAG: RNA polymerase sigma factor [Chitinophagaceae bacterium]